MATRSNLVLTKNISGTSRSVTIHNVTYTEDYDNSPIFIEPGKGQDNQGTSGVNSAARTTIKDRLIVRHAVEISGWLQYDDTNTAEFQKLLLTQMMLHGKLSSRPVQLTGLQRINGSGTIEAVTMDGVISKVSFKSPAQDTATENEEAIEVTLQFIEGGATENNRFLKNRDMR